MKYRLNRIKLITFQIINQTSKVVLTYNVYTGSVLALVAVRLL